ncbi:NAD-dependent epimerase/dehydratase family protein [Mucilaginibacter sp.]
MKGRILITGASGFVGYHLITEALKNNLEVYAAIRKSSNVEHLKGLNIQFTYPDFGNAESLRQEFKEKQYDYVIHAAGVTKARSGQEYHHINTVYTRNLAQAAVSINHHFKKMVFISSLAAIGPLHTSNGILTEHTEPKPVTAYGKSKLKAEQELHQTTTLNYTILRPTAVYGPREKDIFIFIKQIAKGLEPYIGNKAQKLSFVYVTDLAKASVTALEGGDRKTYNLSDGNFYDRYEMADIAKSILNTKAIKLHLPMGLVKLIASVAQSVSRLKNQASALNIEKLKELTAANWNCSIEEAKIDLGFYPQYNLQKGLTETLAWYKANKWL